MFLIFVLDALEQMIVSPVDRAAKIRLLLEESTPDELEGSVAKMLASVAPRRQAAL